MRQEKCLPHLTCPAGFDTTASSSIRRVTSPAAASRTSGARVATEKWCHRHGSHHHRRHRRGHVENHEVGVAVVVVAGDDDAAAVDVGCDSSR